MELAFAIGKRTTATKSVAKLGGLCVIMIIYDYLKSPVGYEKPVLTIQCSSGGTKVAKKS